MGTQRRRGVSVLALMLAVLLLAAGGSAAGPPTRRIVIGQGELVSSFDYPTDWAIAATWIHSNIGDCLVWKDRKTSEFVPWLAERWQRVNPTTWRFFLRRGVRFHNGEPFNAAAVKFTYDRILKDEKFLVYAQWTFIDQIRVVDDHTVEVTTDAPEPAMLSKMSGTGCQIIPPRYFAQVGAQGFARRPVGTGPFRFVQEVKDSRVVLAANTGYFRGRPEIDELVFRALPEASTRVNELLTGGVDLIVDVLPQDWERVRSNPNTKLVIAQGNATQLIVTRMADKAGGTYVLADKRLRAAVEHAIDKKALVDLIRGMGVPTRTRVTPPTFGWHEALYGPQRGNIFDLERAKRLMQEAGYRGETIEFMTSTGRWFMSREVAEAITAMLRRAGFTIDLKVLDVTTFNEQYYFPAYQGRPVNRGLMMDALGNSFFDPWITVLEAHCTLGPQRTGYCNAEVDRLIEAGTKEMDTTRRAAIYKRLQEILAEDRPLIYLYHGKGVWGLNNRLQWEPAPDTFLWMGNAKVTR